MKKKMIAVVMTLVLILSAVSVTPSMTTYAKTKSPKLSKKKIVMTVGKTQKVKLENVSQKVKWTVAKKQVVKITKKSGKYNNSIVIKGLKAGSTKITAKCGKKKYKVKVTVKKVAVPSISTTQQPTTKGTETTTSKSTETTTAKVVETTTFREVEVTTSKEIEMTTTEETTEETTEPELTTGVPTEQETTVKPEAIESTTEEQSLEELTTAEETTEPETTRETKLVAELLNDVITLEGAIGIDIYFDGPTDVVLWTNFNPHKLEIYEDGEWKELELKIHRDSIIGTPTIEYGKTVTLAIPIYAYEDIRPGHYRYTHSFGPHYTYEGDNPFGNSISVEFDAIYPKFYITGKAKKEQIEITEDLEITYTILTESEEEYTYGMQPYALVQDKGIMEQIWMPLDFIESIPEHNYQTKSGSGTIDVTVSLKEIYGDLPAGKYIYRHEIAGKKVDVEFEIVKETSLDDSVEGTTES